MTYNEILLIYKIVTFSFQTGDEPPYLAVGTEVSAKYRGAFCEAKVKKLVRSVKCKVCLITDLIVIRQHWTNVYSL